MLVVFVQGFAWRKGLLQLSNINNTLVIIALMFYVLKCHALVIYLNIFSLKLIEQNQINSLLIAGSRRKQFVEKN